MIFIVLNALLAGFLIYASVNVNTKNQGTGSSMVGIMMLDAVSTLMLLFALISIKFDGPETITNILHHLVIFLVAAIFIEISLMFIKVSKKSGNAVDIIVRIILLLAAGYISFAKMKIKNAATFDVISSRIFTGTLGTQFPIEWHELFVVLFIFVIPLFSLLIMLLNGENSNSRVTIQRTVLCFGTLLFGWAGLLLIFYISAIMPMAKSLFMYMLAVMSVMLSISISYEKIFDGSKLFSSILSMFIKYLLPAVLGAFIYVWLAPMAVTKLPLFVLLVSVSVFALMLIGRYVSSGLAKLIKYRSSQYDADFEQALASINYESELSNIAQEFFKAFQDNLQTGSMTVTIDSGSDEYTTAYNSEGKTHVIPKNQKVRDLLLKNENFIIFRSEVETNYLLQPIQEELENIFEETESEVLIILHEGNYILGHLFLGEKRTGGAYDDYDKQMFDKFYSYFFVFGYYMKNIANASVVGTVNREIRMSSQIITSIQENMDYIKNPKIDVGYLMVPAHNIGGEFVDMIRLNDTSHIMVVGSLSGKGISASMSMVILKSIIRTFLADTHDFKELIQKVNAFIRANLPKGTFFSGIFCLIDFENDTMYYINCGIPTMLMYSKTYNNVIEIQGKGYVLGFVKDVSPLVKVKQVKLTPGDMLAVSTNGLINSHSLRGDTFGKERIKQALMDNYTYPSARIARFTFDNLQRFMSKELEDDITMVVIRYFGKDSSMYMTDEDSAQERLVDHTDSFDADALLADAMNDDSSSTVESVVTASSDEIIDPEVEVSKQTEEIPGAEDIPVDEIVDENIETDRIIEDTADFNISDVFDEDMFNADFSNPNDGISIDDIVDPDSFEELEEK